MMVIIIRIMADPLLGHEYPLTSFKSHMTNYAAVGRELIWRLVDGLRVV